MGGVALGPGSTAGPYRIVEPLGRGGMASVYRAYEAKLDRYVALKVLPREFLHDPSFAQRFRQEAQVIARLEHPGIVPIYAYDIEAAEGIPWMAMRLITAGSLAELIRRERLSLARSVAILGGVADALDYAHAKGVVHRDVKPQNVLLDEAARVYLADFGIAKILESAGGLTASGMITGTPQYMAPEQATGLKVGPAADVYALGIVAYEMFTGRVPFAADTPIAVLMKHVQEPLPLPAPGVLPEPMLRALLRATAKKPEDRWPTAGAFAQALAAALTAREAATTSPTIALPRSPPAPTIASAAAPAAPPGTAPPLPARAPVMRPPAPDRRPAEARKGTALGTTLLALAGLGLLVIVLAVAGWLLGRERPPAPAGPREPEGVVERAPSPAAREDSARAATPPPGSGVRVGAPVSRPARTAPTPDTPKAPPTEPPAAPPPTRPPTAAPTAPPTAAPTAAPTAPAADPEVERLRVALSDRDSATRRRAAQELGARGPLAAPALEELVAALADRSPDVRMRSAEALGRIGARAAPATSALAGALRDSDALVAAEAAKSLGLMGDAAAPAAAALGAALSHRDVAVRREAARALARIGRRAEAALAALVGGLSDKDKTVCAQSARALGLIGPAARSALPRLTALSRDPDVLVSREAQAALEGIGRPQP